jgi:hypothetical protein
MDADEPRFKDAQAFVFDLRLSAFISGQPAIAFFRNTISLSLHIAVRLSRRSNP